VEFQSEISELSSVIADKLDFLEVTRSGLSRLQLLLVQFEVELFLRWICRFEHVICVSSMCVMTVK